MTTRFRVYIADEELRYARQGADATFEELARLESLLSRFREGSDVRRLSSLARGEAARVSTETLECLRTAEMVREWTSGAFDVAYASKGRRGGIAFTTESSTNTVRSTCDNLRIDLGGIGKGFALDRMAALLQEWDIAHAFLSAGTSTHLALDPPKGEAGWPTEFGPDDVPQTHVLVRSAFSASGTARRGRHVIDPGTGTAAQTRIRAWAWAETGALADALSTAFLLLPEAQIGMICRTRASVGAYLENAGGVFAPEDHSS